MTDLYPIFSRLGLAQYVERFSEEGFETWEIVLDITESDLYDRVLCLWCQANWRFLRDALGVKLGHRRVRERRINVHFLWTPFVIIELTLVKVLQREIAQTRGMTVESLNSPFRSGHHDDRQGHGGDESRADGQGAGGKRKYRRHPKVSTFLLWLSVLFRFSPSLADSSQNSTGR